MEHKHMSEIYSASLFDAFQSQILTIGLLVGLGLLAIPMVFLGRRGMASRIVIGVFSVLLIVAGLAVAAVTAQQYSSGSRVLTAKLTRKQVVETVTSDGQSTTQSYRLSFGGTTDFDVPQSAYEKMIAQECYQVKYYPAKSLFAMLGQSTDAPPIASGAVSSIEQTGGPQCP
jgi:hypothetical protein